MIRTLRTGILENYTLKVCHERPRRDATCTVNGLLACYFNFHVYRQPDATFAASANNCCGDAVQLTAKKIKSNSVHRAAFVTRLKCSLVGQPNDVRRTNRVSTSAVRLSHQTARTHAWRTVQTEVFSLVTVTLMTPAALRRTAIIMKAAVPLSQDGSSLP